MVKKSLLCESKKSNNYYCLTKERPGKAFTIALRKEVMNSTSMNKLWNKKENGMITNYELISA